MKILFSHVTSALATASEVWSLPLPVNTMSSGSFGWSWTAVTGNLDCSVRVLHVTGDVHVGPAKVEKMLSMEALISSHMLSLWGCWCIERLRDLIHDVAIAIAIRPKCLYLRTDLWILLQDFQLTKRIYLTLYPLDISYLQDERGKDHFEFFGLQFLGSYGSTRYGTYVPVPILCTLLCRVPASSTRITSSTRILPQVLPYSATTQVCVCTYGTCLYLLES